MKRLKYAVILLLGLSMATTMMTSCTKDKTQLIVGEWKVISAIRISSGASTGEEGLVFTFNEKTTTFPELFVTITYEINGDTLSIKLSATNIETYTIVELTNSSLILEGQYMRYVLERV